jgi:RimJ/RimL family protein N-acetyltransferase
MLRPTYPIATERLLLRPFEEADRDVLAAMNGDPEIVRYLPYGVREGDELSALLERKMRSTELADEGDVLSLAAVLAATGELVADMTLIWRSREHRQGEIGYVVARQHTGRGYATEASRPLLRLGFEGLGLHRMYGRIDARNGASARVLERLGMRREAHFVENERLKGEWTEEVVYALLEREWRDQLPRTP